MVPLPLPEVINKLRKLGTYQLASTLNLTNTTTATDFWGQM
ncbi:MAG: hypothetical protein ACI8Q3_001733, partial [Marinomonas primoryensis]